MFFVTNNSTKTRDEYVKVMENFGIDAKKVDRNQLHAERKRMRFLEVLLQQHLI